MKEISTIKPPILFILLYFFTSFFLKALNANAETNMVKKIDANVKVCSESTRVNDAVSGNKESMIYLLPTAANKAPTGSPNRGSTSFG